MEDGVRTPLGSDGLHHVGATVADLDRSLAFWEPFLGRARRFKTVLERPYLGQILGFPGVQIDAAFVDLPGGVILELLDYRLPDRVPHTDDTRHPGNVHLCFRVEDADAAWRHAVDCGARPVDPGGPVELDGGPNEGAKVAYLRDPDGISVELFQMPPHLVERRYERVPAATLERLREEAPLAYVPIGPLEHHGPHLPMGVDGFSAHELSLRAARISGGVVLPATYLATGCLDLPGTLTFSNELVERFAAETIQQLHHRGFRAVVLLSGHGPMDLIHLLKRVGRSGGRRCRVCAPTRCTGWSWRRPRTRAWRTHSPASSTTRARWRPRGCGPSCRSTSTPSGCPRTATPRARPACTASTRATARRSSAWRAWRPARRCSRSAPPGWWPVRTSTPWPTSSASSTASGPSRCGSPGGPATPTTRRCWSPTRARRRALLTGITRIAIEGREVPLGSVVLVNQSPGESGVERAAHLCRRRPASTSATRRPRSCGSASRSPRGRRAWSSSSSSAGSQRVRTTRWSRSRGESSRSTPPA